MGGVIVALVLAAIGSAGGSGKPDATPAPTTAAVVTPAPTDSATLAPTGSPQPTLAPTPQPTPAPTPKPTQTPAPTPKPTPALTASQRNAIAKAQDYLNYTSFSRSGLIDQLVYEGFTKTVSTFAVDSLKVDWNEQAYLKAQDYLAYTSFSLRSLIDQLVYDRFTKAQATYGATKAYGG